MSLPDNTAELLTALNVEFYNGPLAHADAFRILPRVVEELKTNAKIKLLCTQICMGRNWHELSFAERLLVNLLENSGHLEPAKNGYVGWPPPTGKEGKGNLEQSFPNQVATNQQVRSEVDRGKGKAVSPSPPPEPTP